jgi:predicted LPLAT superfamily acyltransferase
MKLNELRKALESPHSHMGHEERVRAIAKLPPYEHVVALVKGLGASSAKHVFHPSFGFNI